jgi:hypothetical protein
MVRLHCVGFAVAGAGIVFLAAKTISDSYSELVDSLSTSPVIATDVVRRKFVSSVLPTVATQKGHTHATSAANRNVATLFGATLAADLGVSPYYLQMSKANQRAGLRGSRKYYWMKDVTTEARVDARREDDLDVMIDVDYYVDMNHQLSDRNHFKPMLLYTIEPSEAACEHEGDYSYTFVDNKIRMTVDGGATYEHELWDWSGDFKTVTRKFLGIPYYVAAYNVDRKLVAKNRVAIMLTPARSWFGLSAVMASLLSGSRLRRFKPCAQGFTRFDVQGPEGRLVTTAREGGFAVSTIARSLDDQVAEKHHLSKVPITIASAASILGGDKAAATITVAYHRTTGPRKWPIVFTVADAIRAYHFEPAVYEDEKPGIQAYSSPYLHECFAPVLNAASERRCVQGRIVEVRPDGDLRADRFGETLQMEFIDLFCRDRVLQPCDHEEVVQKQDRPQQQRILENANNFGDAIKRTLSCFIKKEPYGEAGKDPRNISTIHCVDKLEYSRFQYSLGALLKEEPWYAFGKTPAAIAEAVATLASTAKTVVMTDFSRMDGRVSGILRVLEKRIMTRLFPDFRDEIDKLLTSQYNLKGFLPMGTSFDQQFSRASGSPETSSFNTIASAFVAYSALRRTKRDGAFLTPAQAYDGLGLYGGDDGFTTDVSEESYAKAAKAVGQKLTVDTLNRGEAGVNFLSRYFSPDVWYGDDSSCCDIARQLSKFHSTVRLPEGIPETWKLVEKASAFYLMDKHTPVIGQIASRVVETFNQGRTSSNKLGVQPWWAKYDKDVQWPNSPGEWMDDLLRQQIPTIDTDLFNTWLEKTTSLVDMLSPPLIAEPSDPTPAKVDYVVDGDLIEVKPTLQLEKQPAATIPKQPRASPKTVQATQSRKEKKTARRQFSPTK